MNEEIQQENLQPESGQEQVAEKQFEAGKDITEKQKSFGDKYGRLIIYGALGFALVLGLLVIGTVYFGNQIYAAILQAISVEGYYCKKCAKFHDLSEYRDITGARWCKNCCRSVAAGVELRFAHCCSCGGQHYPGECTDGPLVNGNIRRRGGQHYPGECSQGNSVW